VIQGDEGNRDGKQHANVAKSSGHVKASEMPWLSDRAIERSEAWLIRRSGLRMIGRATINHLISRSSWFVVCSPDLPFFGSFDHLIFVTQARCSPV
jgi:hypothetical protein